MIRNRVKLSRSFSGRIFILSVAFLVVTMLIIGLTSCISYYKMIRDAENTSNSNYIENYSANIMNMIQKIILYNNEFLMSPETNSYVEDFIRYKDSNYYMSKTMSQNLMQSMTSLINQNQGIKGVQLVTQRYQLTNGLVNFNIDNIEMKYDYLRKMTNSVNQTVFFNEFETMETNPLNQRADTFQLIGTGENETGRWYTIISIDPSFLSSDNDISIFDLSKNIVWRGNDKFDTALLPTILSRVETTSEGTLKQRNSSGNISNYYYMVSPENEWIYVMPADGQTSEAMRDVIWFSAAVIAGLILLVALICFYVSKRFYKPLEELTRDLKNINDFKGTKERQFSGRLLIKWGFKRKMAVFFLISSMMPALVFMLLFFSYSQSRSLQFFEVIVAENMNMIKTNLSMETKNVQQISRYLLMNGAVRAALEHSATTGDVTESISRIIVSENFLKGDISSIELIDRNLKKVYSTNLNNQSTTPVEKEMITEYKNAGFNQGWLYSVRDEIEGYQIPNIRKVYRYVTGDGSSVSGYVVINVNGNSFSQVLENSRFKYWGTSYIYNKDKKIIYADNMTSEIPVEPETESGIRLENGARVYIDRKNEQIFFYSDFTQEPWTLVNVIPTSDLYTVLDQLMAYAMVMGLIVILLIVYLSDFFTNRMLLPIYRIRQDIKEIEIGNLGEEQRPLRSDDDLQYISDDIYNLVFRANRLLGEVYAEQAKVNELEMRKNEAELISLQNQINPHFLYNTFTTVKFLVDLAEYAKAKEMITSLGKLFRLGVYRGQIIVSVKEEVEHAEAYVNIQKMRYEDGLRVDWFMDSNIFQYRTLKFILQPLIENAIQYGVEAEKKDNIITICGYIKDDALIFEVIDNGIGIEKEKIDALIQQIEGKVETSRVGLKNINERIRLSCGKNYGIHFESEQGVYTRMIVKMKLME
ncbi:hypothetical protein AGMMS49983_06370 [Clostridia bacterium]|nr:hypothetical protein AGMMS49983_06370 [Clostridia bacterium]